MRGSDEQHIGDLRGRAPRKRRSVRTLAAFGQNPSCGLATLAFAAEVDLDVYLADTQYEAPFGQSPFAITRGNRFEAKVKDNDYWVPLTEAHTAANLVSPFDLDTADTQRNVADILLAVDKRRRAMAAVRTSGLVPCRRRPPGLNL